MPSWIGAPEMLFLLFIVLLLFGPKNLPKLANSIGRAVRDFKSGLSGVDQEIRTEIEKAGPIETKAETRVQPEVRPAEVRPAEVRPAEVRPAEARPAEPRPEIQTVEAKPVHRDEKTD